MEASGFFARAVPAVPRNIWKHTFKHEFWSFGVVKWKLGVCCVNAHFWENWNPPNAVLVLTAQLCLGTLCPILKQEWGAGT